MEVADLPEEGLAFFSLRSGRIVLRPAVTTHFDLLEVAAESDDWAVIEKWVLRDRPRFGRIGRRGGRADLTMLTKPLGRPVAASEDELEELDLPTRARVLSAVENELRRI
ncbi:MAG TPA: hypothetical protein VJ814_10935 [Gaiellaceae bacterium]|nr:hypothetical protein [Gaiellaceae bacterium]